MMVGSYRARLARAIAAAVLLSAAAAAAAAAPQPIGCFDEAALAASPDSTAGAPTPDACVAYCAAPSRAFPLASLRAADGRCGCLGVVPPAAAARACGAAGAVALFYTHAGERACVLSLRICEAAAESCV